MSESNNGDFRNFKDLEKGPGDKPVTLETDRELPPGIASERAEVVVENLASRGMIIPADKSASPETTTMTFDSQEIRGMVDRELQNMMVRDISVDRLSLAPQKDGAIRLDVGVSKLFGKLTISCLLDNGQRKISIQQGSLKIEPSFLGRGKFDEQKIKKELEDIDAFIRKHLLVGHGKKISRIQIVGDKIEISYEPKKLDTTSPKPDETIVLKRSGDGLTIKSHGEGNERFVARLSVNPRVNATAEDVSAVEALINEPTKEIPKTEGSTDATLIPASHEEFADSSEAIGEEPPVESPSVTKAPESESASAIEENPLEQEIWSPRSGMAPALPESTPADEDLFGSLVEEPTPAIETPVTPPVMLETAEPQSEPVVEPKAEEPTAESSKVESSEVEVTPEPSASVAPKEAPVAESEVETVESEDDEEPVYLSERQWLKIGKGFERLSKRAETNFDPTALKWKVRKKGEKDVIDISGIPDASFTDYEIIDLDLYGSARISLRDKGLVEQDPIQTTSELHAYYPQLKNIIDALDGMVSDETMPELLNKADRILAAANEDDLEGVEVVLEFDEENIAKDGNDGIVGTSGILILNLADNSERLMGFVVDEKTFTELHEKKEKYEEGIRRAVEEAQEAPKATHETLKNPDKTEEAPVRREEKEIKALADLRKRYNEGTEFIDVFPGTMSLENREALIAKARRAIKALPDRALRGVKFILQSGLDFPSKLVETGRIIVNLDDDEKALIKFLEKAIQERKSKRKEADQKKPEPPSTPEVVAHTKTEQEKV